MSARLLAQKRWGDQRRPTRERFMAEVGIAGERPESIALVEIVAEEITVVD